MVRLPASGLVLLLVFSPAQEKRPDQEKGKVQERVTVDRVVVTGRVIDRFANPLPGLAANDFRLHVDGREIPIESVEWIPARRDSEQNPVPLLPETPPETEERPRLAAPSRLTVMLFQWEIAGQKDVGFVRMMRQAKRIVESAGRDDRIAVLGFGSSLRLLQDFTTNRAAVEEAILKIRSPNWGGRAEDADAETLSAADGCERADSIEKALVCIGSALQRLPGPKTLLFFGWTAATTRDSWRVHYPSIIEAIGKAETSVFVLDVSDGKRYGKRVLPESLKTLAYETGGLYHETFDFPDLARQRVQRSLDGYYELVFRDPAAGHGWHQVEVELTGGSGTALFHRWYRS
jgi:VWFA-related protein